MSESSATQKTDLPTMIGLVLLLSPLLTMGHEIGGHASVCALTGGHLREIGAYYIQCDSATPTLSRLVAVAGAGMDVIIATLAYVLFRNARSDLARLCLWMIAVTKGMTATGYLLFSSVTNFGDFGLGPDGGLGDLPHPLVWRGAFILIGGITYFGVVRVAVSMLRQMLGQGPDMLRTQKRIAMTLYLANGAVAIIVGLLNPVGFLILVMSAMASSFGGLAGLFSLANWSSPPGEARSFVIARNWPIIVAGLIVTIAFALVLGPSVHFA